MATVIYCRDRSPSIPVNVWDHPRAHTLQRIELYWRRLRDSNGVKR